MQDELPDVTAVATNPEQPVAAKPSFFSRIKGAGSDDKRVVKLILIVAFGGLLVLGIAASVLEKVAPRGGATTAETELFTSGQWQITVQPGQAIFGFYLDENNNRQYDYQEKPFEMVSVAIRRSGETEPFRYVSAENDGLVKINDLAQGQYEVSFANYADPVKAGAAAGEEWLFFEEYQQNLEFLPTAWRPVELAGSGYKELVGISTYQPPFLLVLKTENGVSWYDPERAREYAKSNFSLKKTVMRGNDIYYLEAGNLKKLNWVNRAVTEELIWLEEAENGWDLSPGGQTAAYLSGKEFQFRSRNESCAEGGLLWEGVRPEVAFFSFIGETAWLVAARPSSEQPRQLYRLNCNQAGPVSTLEEPTAVGRLENGAWFYSTATATYLVDADGKAVKYNALGGQAASASDGGITTSADGRYLLKKLASGNWLVVDYPAVKGSGVEKHYLLTGISGEPAVFGDSVYYVRAKTCGSDGDCGEVVKIRLEGSGVWSVETAWDLKNVAAAKVLGVVE